MASAGATDLEELIQSMEPTLHLETYVYVTILFASPKAVEVLPKVLDGNVKMLFRETEGWTIILPKQTAQDHDLEHAFECRQLTLNVHSSLDAVGFLAAITSRLAKLDTGVNPVSAYYHDHLFVPAAKAHSVMAELKAMAAGSG